MYKYKPSKASINAFKIQLAELQKYLAENRDIYGTIYSDSFYFTYEGKTYRISNHANTSVFHNEPDIKIHASKTRLIGIHKAIKSGCMINGRGHIVQN